MSYPQINYFQSLLLKRLTMLRESVDREELHSNRTYAAGFIAAAHATCSITEDARLRTHQLIDSALEQRRIELSTNALPYTRSAGAKA